MTPYLEFLDETPILHFDDIVIRFPMKGHLSFWPCAGEITEVGLGDGIWLSRTEGGGCLLATAGVTATVNESLVYRLAFLQHGDIVRAYDQSAIFLEIVRAKVTDDLVGLPICPFCGDPFDLGKIVLQCPPCRAIYHEDCWSVLTDKRCCSRACTFVPHRTEAVD